MISEPSIISGRGDEPLHLVWHPVSSEHDLTLLVSEFGELFGDHVVSSLGLEELIPLQVLDPVPKELDIGFRDGGSVQSVTNKVEGFLVEGLFNDRGV